MVREADGHFRRMSPDDAVAAFKRDLPFWIENGMMDLTKLRGKNLACWCSKGEPCHGDVLLALANGVEP